MKIYPLICNVNYTPYTKSQNNLSAQKKAFKNGSDLYFSGNDKKLDAHSADLFKLYALPNIIKRILVTQKNIPFRDKDTGMIKEAIVSFIKSDNNTEDIIISVDDECVASGTICKDILMTCDELNNNKIKCKPNCLYIRIMHSYKERMGTVFHKAVAQRSKDHGFDGRVMLISAWASAPFHYSCGYRELGYNGTTKDIPEVENLIKKSKESGKRIEGNCGCYELYLTKEKAQELLDRPI